MQRSNYTKPQVDIVRWEKADVITTSGQTSQIKVVDDVSVINDTNVTVDADYAKLQ